MMKMIQKRKVKESVRHTRIDVDPNFLKLSNNSIIEITAGNDDSRRNKALKRLLRRTINGELTTEQKRVFFLYYYKQMNQTKIAEMLGASPQSVSAMLNRAVKRIKKIMKYFF